MKCTYALICNTYPGRTSFGVQAANEAGHTVAEAKDISGDQAKVARLVQLCNNLDLSSLHFFDVVDDFIG